MLSKFRSFILFTKISARRLKALQKQRQQRAHKAHKNQLKVENKIVPKLKNHNVELQETIDMVNSKT
jgi:hypothetical protein